jgi:hypothetical protein
MEVAGYAPAGCRSSSLADLNHKIKRLKTPLARVSNKLQAPFGATVVAIQGNRENVRPNTAFLLTG